MSVRLVVAVTDGDWFEFLRNRRDLSEINFWAPSGDAFKALHSGELFLFKLHAPRNFIVGGGVFAHATKMPCGLAWQAFGEGNGAASLEDMRARIARYRRSEQDRIADFEIGCRILTQPFFLDEAEWLRAPSSWAPNIVRFKTFLTDDPEAGALWELLQERTQPIVPMTGLQEEAARYGAPSLIEPRLGQGAFRILVTDAYERRCAVTGERTLPALDAAHIRPFSAGGMHSPRNGLLLRRDIHSLFDTGYVTITKELDFEVSKRIREEFENGREYYRLHGSRIRDPKDHRLRPDPKFIEWHNQQFRG